jgi:uncharacterized membrane protein YdjX (TVP38/TMEM64 family)
VSTPAAPPRRLVPRALLVKFALLVALVALGVVVVRFTPAADYLTREAMTDLLARLRGLWWAPLAFIGLFAVLSPMGLPMSPRVVGGAVVFGVAWGTLWNTLGLFVGAAVSFAIARLLGRDFVAHFAGDRLRAAEAVFERHGFWPLVQIRFLPLPFAVVNFGAALAGVRAPMFLAASAVGMIPATLVHTYFIARLVAAPDGRRVPLMIAYGLCLAALATVSALPTIRTRWRMRRERKAAEAE